jgi:hypothetical protein
MELTIELTALEVATLESIRVNPNDSLETVIRSVLLAPFTDRHITRMFRGVDTTKQDAVIDALAGRMDVPALRTAMQTKKKK